MQFMPSPLARARHKRIELQQLAGVYASCGAKKTKVRHTMCSKGRVLCWKGKFFLPLNMFCFCKMLCVRGLLILPMFEG